MTSRSGGICAIAAYTTHFSWRLARRRADGSRSPHALAHESQRLGDEGEPLRFVAHDLAELVRLGMGEKHEFDLQFLAHACRPTGPSPQGTWEMLFFLMPLLALRDDDSVGWAARLAERIAVRLAAPRAELQASSWIVASELGAGRRGRDTELAGLLEKARRGTPGLRGLPVFLLGYAERNYDAFQDAEHLARRAGNVWLQVSALVWMLAMEPQASTARRLHKLLDITAWRQPILTPPEVAADAALAMTASGERGRSILELALISAGRRSRRRSSCATSTTRTSRAPHAPPPSTCSGWWERCRRGRSSRGSRSATMT